MSAFSNKSFNTVGYFLSRPDYPESFYQILKNYHETNQTDRKNGQRVLDIGCGPGIATFQMTQYLNENSPENNSLLYKHFLGADISSVMIQKANNELQKRQETNNIDPNLDIKFDVCSYDNIGQSNCALNKFDLITAVECVHWFDFDTFQKTVYDDLLLSGGTIAIWGYADAILIDYPDLDDITIDLAYAHNQLGPYWQQPGRNVLCHLLDVFKFDSNKFDNIKESYFHAEDFRKNKQIFNNNDILKICKTCTLQQYENYLKTFSAYHTWKLDPQNANKPDPCETYINEIIKRHPELSRDSTVNLIWNTFYKFATRKGCKSICN